MSLSSLARLMLTFYFAIMPNNAGMETATASKMECGGSSSTDTAIIVKMTGLFLKFLFWHFKREGLNNEEVYTKLKYHSNWYRLVDERHSPKSLVKLLETYYRWKAFRWLCTLAPCGHPSQYPEQDHICLNSFRLPSSGTHVERAYSGLFGQQNSTIVQTANTMIRYILHLW